MTNCKEMLALRTRKHSIQEAQKPCCYPPQFCSSDWGLVGDVGIYQDIGIIALYSLY